MVYRGYHIHESDRDRTLMERKEHYEDRRNTFNFTKKDELLRPATSRLSQYHKHFNYSVCEALRLRTCSFNDTVRPTQ